MADHESEQRAHDSPSEDEEPVQKPRELPADLPRSLDDRKSFPSYNQETEYYDAWQGEPPSNALSSVSYMTLIPSRSVTIHLRAHPRETDQFQPLPSRA